MAVPNQQEPAEERQAEGRVLFGEELGREQPRLPELLADVQRHLEGLGERYGQALSGDEKFLILDEALDELDGALERVREARAKLLRIEVRLAASYERAVASIRTDDLERP
jgi:hypothetical protein